MRKQISKTQYAREGERVEVVVYHSGGEDINELAVYSAGYGDDLSPHVDDEVYQLVSSRPMMVAPASIRLTRFRPEHLFEFTPKEDTYFAVMQSIDTQNENLAYARIKRYGIFNQAIKRTLAYFRGLGSNRASARFP